jgi:hypothetical protein
MHDSRSKRERSENTSSGSDSPSDKFPEVVAMNATFAYSSESDSEESDSVTS